jgi:uncharacterized protein DUF3467
MLCRSRASSSGSCGSTREALAHLTHPTYLIYTAGMAELKQINFTIVPDDGGRGERTYANFCAISQTPFDCTLTFCEVLPLSEEEIRSLNASAPGVDTVVRAPVRARVVVPFQVLPNLVAALQEQLRNAGGAPGPGPVH